MLDLTISKSVGDGQVPKGKFIVVTEKPTPPPPRILLACVYIVCRYEHILNEST